MTVKFVTNLPEALALARETDKPIWLVVEGPYIKKGQEFGEEASVLLTDFFVPCKIKAAYEPLLAEFAVNMVSLYDGALGWPAHLALNGKGEPFFAAGPLSTAELDAYLPRVKWLWLMNREKVDLAASDIGEKIKSASIIPAPVTPKWEIWAKESAHFKQDTAFGGYGGGVKKLDFPRFALALHLGERDFCEITVGAIAVVGALRDWVWGGYRPYSLSTDWADSVPWRTLRSTAATLLAATMAGLAANNKKLLDKGTDAELRSFSVEGRLREEDALFDDRGGYEQLRKTYYDLDDRIENKGIGQGTEFYRYAGRLNRSTALDGPENPFALPLINEPFTWCEQTGLTPQHFFASLSRHNQLMAERGMPLPMSEQVTLGSTAWALYAGFKSAHLRGEETPPWLSGTLIRLLREVDEFDTLPALFNGKTWEGVPTLEAYGALALALIEQGEEVFALRAKQLLRQGLALFFDGGINATAQKELPYLSLGAIDQALPSPLAGFIAALLRSGDEEFMARGRELIESLTGLIDSDPSAYPGLIAVGLECNGERSLW